MVVDFVNEVFKLVERKELLFQSFLRRLVRQWHSLIILGEYRFSSVLFNCVFKEHEDNVAGSPDKLGVGLWSGIAWPRTVIFVKVQQLVEPHVVLPHLLFVENALQVQRFVVICQVVFDRLIWHSGSASPRHWSCQP